MRRLIFPLILVGFAACQPATEELTDAEKTAIASEVDVVNAEFWNAWRAADWDRGMSYYYDSPEFVWASGGEVYFGKSTLDAYKPSFENVASQSFVFHDTRIVVMAPDAVSVTSQGLWSQTDTAGVKGPDTELVWTGVWVRREGKWKIHLAHLSYPPSRPDQPM